MKIIDSHQHIGIDPYDKTNIGKYISSLQSKNKINHIVKSVVTIFPHMPEMMCPNDKRHLVQVRDDNIFYETICKECGFHVRNEMSPYYQANVDFLQYCKNINWIIPYAVMIVSNNINREVKSLLEECPWVSGLKLYTGYSEMILNEIKRIDCHLPLLIHTGIYPNQNLDSMMKFIINYDGPVQVAHFGRFDVKNITILSKYDHVFFDCAPANYLYRYQTKKLFMKDFYCVDEMYYRIIDLIGIDKLVWGSDVPFGDIKEELDLINRMSLSLIEKEKLLYWNIKERLRIVD